MRPERVVTVTVTALFVIAAPGLAERTWDLPEGIEPAVVEPFAFPEGMVGPITFAEAEFPEGTMIDGLAVDTLDGSPLPAPLSFAFSSADATINGGPGDITYVQFPNIEGDSTGTLTIDFGGATTSVTFGFALSCGPPITDGATAQALNAQGNPVGPPVSVDALDFDGGFAENQLTLSPGGSFRAAEITFNSADGACSRFAFDNLTYDFQGVPTLPSGWIAGLVLVLLLTGMQLLTRRHI